MHEAFCAERESMHLTISIAPLTFSDLLAKALKAAAESDVRFRRRVRWSVSVENGDAQISAEGTQLASDLARQIDVRPLLSSERDTLQGLVSTELPDSLESAIKSAVER